MPKLRTDRGHSIAQPEEPVSHQQRHTHLTGVLAASHPRVFRIRSLSLPGKSGVRLFPPRLQAWVGKSLHLITGDMI